MPLSQHDKLVNYHQRTLFPLYQDIILSLQNDLRRSFQTYGVHENTLREFMLLWEKLLAAELGIQEKDVSLGENEVDLLLDEVDDILDDDLLVILELPVGSVFLLKLVALKVERKVLLFSFASLDALLVTEALVLPDWLVSLVLLPIGPDFLLPSLTLLDQ